MKSIMCINKYDPKYSVFEFLYQAISKSPIKPVFTGFYFDEGNIVTTDSRRLHLVYDESFKNSFENGLFLVQKAKDSFIITENIDATFPNYKQVLITDLVKSKIIYTFPYSSLREDLIGRIIYYVSKHLNATLNYSFLLDLLKIKKNNSDWHIRIIDEKSPIQFEGYIKSFETKALIMPILIKGEE